MYYGINTYGTDVRVQKPILLDIRKKQSLSGQFEAPRRKISKHWVCCNSIIFIALQIRNFTWSFEPVKLTSWILYSLVAPPRKPNSPPIHLLETITQIRDWTQRAVENNTNRDIWELARLLFTPDVCQVLRRTQPKPWVPVNTLLISDCHVDLLDLLDCHLEFLNF